MPGNARPATHREGHSRTRVAATELVCPDDGTALAGRCSTLYDVPVLTVNVPPASRRPRVHWRRPGGSGPCSALPHDAEEHIHVTGAWPTCGHRLGSGPGSDQAVAPAAVWPAGCGQLLGSGPGIDHEPVRVARVVDDSRPPGTGGTTAAHRSRTGKQPPDVHDAGGCPIASTSRCYGRVGPMAAPPEVRTGSPSWLEACLARSQVRPVQPAPRVKTT